MPAGQAREHSPQPTQRPSLDARLDTAHSNVPRAGGSQSANHRNQQRRGRHQRRGKGHTFPHKTQLQHLHFRRRDADHAKIRGRGRRDTDCWSHQGHSSVAFRALYLKHRCQDTSDRDGDWIDVGAIELFIAVGTDQDQQPVRRKLRVQLLHGKKRSLRYPRRT